MQVFLAVSSACEGLHGSQGLVSWLMPVALVQCAFMDEFGDAHNFTRCAADLMVMVRPCVSEHVTLCLLHIVSAAQPPQSRDAQEAL